MSSWKNEINSAVWEGGYIENIPKKLKNKEIYL